MKNLIIQLLLLIVGCIVFPCLFVVGFCYTSGKHLWRLDYSFSKQLTPIVRSINLVLDGLANAGAGEMLNDVYRVTDTIKYGQWYQTISAVTGLLLLHVKDTKLRVFLDKVLGSNHCVEAISKEDLFFYEKIK
jgi:carbohydrate-binding DOMON domain-containing protein